MSDNNPLVSVFIVTYNAEDYICETLDSVKAQTYEKIELIVSDDKSSDNTVSLVKDWLKNNSQRFVRAEVVESPVNTGTAANYNRAVNACRGEWLKMLDGDDLLLPRCIEYNLAYVKNQKNAEIVFSNVQNFKIVNGEKINVGYYFTKEHISFFTLNSLEQLKMLLKNNILPSASCFLKASIFDKFHYDESYYCLEDAPMWYKLLQNEIRFYGFNEITAMYRIGESTMRGEGVYFKRPYFDSYIKYFWNVKIELLRKYNLTEAYNITRKYILRMEMADLLLNNKRNFFNDIIYLGIKIFVRLSPKFKF